jgi:hypothetical protein
MRIVAGVNASYEAGSLQSTKLAVEVTDQAGAPVPGVAVTFRLPDDGATGVFQDGNRSTVIYTSEQGEAAVSGIRWSATPGDLSIRITAVKGSSHAGILARQELIAGGAPATSPAPAPASTQIARPAAIAPSTATGGSKLTTAATPPAEARAATVAPTAAPRLTSQVTIMTRPEKPKPDSSALATITPLPAATETKTKEPPAVAISSAQPGHSSSGKTKWILLGLAAAGAAAGVAFAMGGSKSSTASTPPTGTTIGAPSISIGHP